MSVVSLFSVVHCTCGVARHLEATEYTVIPNCRKETRFLCARERKREREGEGTRDWEERESARERERE